MFEVDPYRASRARKRTTERARDPLSKSLPVIPYVRPRPTVVRRIMAELGEEDDEEGGLIPRDSAQRGRRR